MKISNIICGVLPLVLFLIFWSYVRWLLRYCVLCRWDPLRAWAGWIFAYFLWKTFHSPVLGSLKNLRSVSGNNSGDAKSPPIERVILNDFQLTCFLLYDFGTVFMYPVMLALVWAGDHHSFSLKFISLV